MARNSTPAFDLLGTGIYTVPEAARMTNVAAARIRRWLRGYPYTSGGKKHEQPPVFKHGLPEIDGTLALGFLDLLEIRFIDGFLRLGVKWPKLRVLHRAAVDLVGDNHPFCAQLFKTDGKTIAAKVSKEVDAPVIMDLANNQQMFSTVVDPYFRGVTFHDGTAVEWWPLGEGRSVVLNPRRRFGLPIIARRGIPTATLVRAYRAEQSVQAISRWMDVTEKEVADAVAYENTLAA